MPASFLRDGKFYRATAVLIGTMVGAGIYGIPFAFAQAGFLVGVLWLLVLVGVIGLFNLLFSELILSTEGSHQIPGYVAHWLGPWAQRVSLAAHFFSMYGALLAYIIIVGGFLHTIFAVDAQAASVVFALVLSLIWLLRVKTIATVELVCIALYTFAIGALFIVGFPSIHSENFRGVHLTSWHLPYGVLLFALSGLSALPLQRQLLRGRERLMRPAIMTALGFTALLYVLFAFVVVGVSGVGTTPSALSGLVGLLGAPAILWGSLLGVLTITTSYIVLGTVLFETFHVDYRQRPWTAWFLAVIPPLVLFLSGLRDFIGIVGLVGAGALGVQSMLILGAYIRARLHRTREAIGLAILFFCGILLELFLR